jgi:hypothetical protein
MAIIKRPQPPGDSGSRRHLINRKGKVDDVEYAYSGIVNVYALRPRGAGPISIKELTGGVVEIPSGATLYPQIGVGPKLSKKALKEVAKEAARAGAISYEWKPNKHEHRDGLYLKIGEHEQGEVDSFTYEKALKDNPTKIAKYDENSSSVLKEINYARMMITKYPSGSDQYNRAILRQAMKMHVPQSQMKYWVTQKYSTVMNVPHVFEKVEKLETKNVKDLIERIIETDDTDPSIRYILKTKYGMNDKQISEEVAKKKKQMGYVEERLESEAKSPESKVVEVVNVDKLPVPIGNIQKLPDNKGDFTLIDGPSAKILYDSDKSKLRYEVTPTGIVRYYVDMKNMSAERRKRINRSRIKRIAYRVKKHIVSKKHIASKKISNSKRVKCTSRSGKIKKSLLNKLRCKCRGKK